MIRKNKNKGFALIEVLAAITLIVLFGGFIISSIFVVPQTKMKETTQLIKTEFELTRSYAMMHGGDAEFTIEKTSDGIILSRTGVKTLSSLGVNSKKNKTIIKDSTLNVYYYESADKDNKLTLKNGETLTFKFSQTIGAIVSSKLLDDEIIIDCIKVANKNKDYTFLIEYRTGLIYFDYELDKNHIINNQPDSSNNEKIKVEFPKFILNGTEVDSITLQYTGDAIQPEIKYDNEYIKIGGVYRAIDKNDKGYVVTFTLKDPSKTQWVNGETETISLIWIIERKD